MTLEHVYISQREYMYAYIYHCCLVMDVFVHITDKRTPSRPLGEVKQGDHVRSPGNEGQYFSFTLFFTFVCISSHFTAFLLMLS
jgi:hypothetical protein